MTSSVYSRCHADKRPFAIGLPSYLLIVDHYASYALPTNPLLHLVVEVIHELRQRLLVKH